MKELFGLEGETALVVGGGYGSGRIAARLLAEAGARVAVADIDAVRARSVAEEIGGCAIAKAGVMSLARTLADEWGPHGVRVNTVAPDITATTRLLDGAPRPQDETLAMFDRMAVGEGVRMRRFGRVHEIADPLLFLLSDLSSYMTGQCLVVDGGTMVRFPHDTTGGRSRK